MITKLEELQSRVAFWIHWIAVVVTIVVVSFIGLMLYWMVEPDPLSVGTYGNKVSVCHNREFVFERYVQSEVALDIFVQQRWYNKDAKSNFGKVEKETVITNPDYYPLGKDFDKVMEFTKCVPDNIKLGSYEYRPWATYKVNPIKTIHKMLPPQQVEIVCDFDPLKHKSCDPNRSSKQ